MVSYNDLSESKSWKVLETILSHPIANIKGVFFYRIIKSETLENTALLNKVCFLNTPCEFLNTSRCVVVTHLFTVLFHGLRKHTKACKETQKVCNVTHLCVC